MPLWPENISCPISAFFGVPRPFVPWCGVPFWISAVWGAYGFKVHFASIHSSLIPRLWTKYFSRGTACRCFGMFWLFVFWNMLTHVFSNVLFANVLLVWESGRGKFSLRCKLQALGCFGFWGCSWFVAFRPGIMLTTRICGSCRSRNWRPAHVLSACHLPFHVIKFLRCLMYLWCQFGHLKHVWCGKARLDALGTDWKGVTEKTELIMLLEQPFSCIRFVLLRFLVNTTRNGSQTEPPAQTLEISWNPLEVSHDILSQAASPFRSQQPSEGVPPFELWVPVSCFLAGMATKTESQAVAFRISSVFDRGAWLKQLFLYSIFVWRLLLHLSHRKNTSEPDVLVRLCGPGVFQNTQGRKTGCTDLCGHALCRMLCASTFSTARPTLSMCNSGRVSTKRQRRKTKLTHFDSFQLFWLFD